MFDVNTKSGEKATRKFSVGADCVSSFGWLNCPGFAFDKSKPKSVPNSMGQRSLPEAVFLGWCNFENDQQATPSTADLFMLIEPGLLSHPNFEPRRKAALIGY